MVEDYLKAIVNLDELNNETDFRRINPSEDLADIIDLFWYVGWNLREGETFKQQLFPNPHMSIVHYSNGTFVEGAVKKLFEYELTGKGAILGVKFKIGGFNSLINENMSVFTNIKFDVNKVLKHSDWVKLSDLSNLNEKIELVESIIRSFDPMQKEKGKRVNEIVEYMRGNHHVVSVDTVSERFNISVRSLQRLFEQYIGVNPKWVIRVFRLQEVKNEIETYTEIDWADLAFKLDYSDQSHMINDFKAFTGITPESFKYKK